MIGSIVKILGVSTLLTFSPSVYELGLFSATKLMTTNKSPIDYDSINVAIDLRLIYGDTNNDGNLTADEYGSFDFKTLVPTIDDKDINEYLDFKYLIMKPVKNDIYFYFYSKSKLGDNTIVNLNYSNSLEASISEGYKEKLLFKELIQLSEYSNELGFFYKYKFENIESYYNDDEYRLKIYDFTVLNDEINKVYDYRFKDEQIIWNNDSDFLENDFIYLTNKTYFYDASIAMALGAINSTTYMPTISIFGIDFNTTNSSEYYVGEAKELSYMFIDFEDLFDVDDLIQVDVAYKKIEYDYIQYAPVTNNSDVYLGFIANNNKNDTFGDVYAGLYESKEYGNLENGFSLNGKKTCLVDFIKEVKVFNKSGETEDVELRYDDIKTNFTEETTRDVEIIGTNSSVEKIFYNPNLYNYFNEFKNVQLMNNGNYYYKTIKSNYNSQEYTYENIINDGSLKHSAIKKSYEFLPIVNLQKLDETFSSDEFKLAANFFDEATKYYKSIGKNYEYAILIDGANSDSDSTRTIQDGTNVLKTYDYTYNWAATSEKEYNYLQERISHCHEIYDAIMYRCTATVNGKTSTYNLVGDPAYTQFVTIVGHSAPNLLDYIVNDISTWRSSLLDQLGNWIYLIAIIIAIILIAILSPILVPIIKFLLKIIALPFKTIFKAIKKEK